MDLIKIAEQAFAQENAIEIPSFNTGDTISVHYKIKEGNKERIQIFKGVVIQIKGTGTTKTFTVRKMSGNVGVERIIPFNSPYIHAIEVNKRGVVRRSRIFYFRELTGKKAKIKEPFPTLQGFSENRASKKASFDTRLFLFPKNFFAET